MRAATYIMDDDLEGAEAGLASGNSAFHKVCSRKFAGLFVWRLIGLGDEEHWLMKMSCLNTARQRHGSLPKSYARF